MATLEQIKSLFNSQSIIASKLTLVNIYNLLYNHLASSLEDTNSEVSRIIAWESIRKTNEFWIIVNEAEDAEWIFNSKILINELSRKEVIVWISELVNLFLGINNKKIIFDIKNWIRWEKIDFITNVILEEYIEWMKSWKNVKIEIYWIPLNELNNFDENSWIKIEDWKLIINSKNFGSADVNEMLTVFNSLEFKNFLRSRIWYLLKDLLLKNGLDFDINFELFDQ